MKNIILTFSILFILGCSAKEDCDYTSIDCGKTTFQEKFDNAIVGSNNSWTTVNGSGVVKINTTNQNKYMSFTDGSGPSYTFAPNFLPLDLLKQGCSISYKVSLSAGSTDKSIGILNTNSYFTHTFKAFFQLNSNSQIIGNSTFKEIIIPISHTTTSELPSNTYGKWVVEPSINPTVDAEKFNQLIANPGAIYMILDVDSSPNVEWLLDDFTIKNCCPNI